MSIIDTSATKKLLWIIFFSFLIRAILPIVAYIKSQDKQIFYAGDSSGYVQLAKELVETGHFATGREPEIKRTPGYPLFLTAGVILGKIEVVTIFLQIIISCLTVFIIYKIASKLFNSHTCGLLGALLYSLEPLSIVFSSIILTETLFTFLITGFLLFIIRYIQDQKFGDLVISALLLSASIYVRPVSYYLVIPISVFLLIIGYYKRTMVKRFISQAAAFFLICVLLLGIWHIRNLKVSGYGGFSAIDAVSVYFHHAAAIEAVRDHKSYYQVRKDRGSHNREKYFNRHPKQRNWTASERFQFMKKEGLKEIRDNFKIYFIIHIKGMLRILIDPGAIYYLKLLSLYPKQAGLLGEIVDRGFFAVAISLMKKKPLVFLSNVFFGIVLIFQLLLAFFALLNKKIFSPACLFMIGIGVYFWIISAYPHSLSRLRHPIMPLICILSSFTLNIFIEKYRIEREHLTRY